VIQLRHIQFEHDGWSVEFEVSEGVRNCWTVCRQLRYFMVFYSHEAIRLGASERRFL